MGRVGPAADSGVSQFKGQLRVATAETTGTKDRGEARAVTLGRRALA